MPVRCWLISSCTRCSRSPAEISYGSLTIDPEGFAIPNDSVVDRSARTDPGSVVSGGTSAGEADGAGVAPLVLAGGAKGAGETSRVPKGNSPGCPGNGSIPLKRKTAVMIPVAKRQIIMMRIGRRIFESASNRRSARREEEKHEDDDNHDCDHDLQPGNSFTSPGCFSAPGDRADFATGWRSSSASSVGYTDSGSGFFLP